MTSSAPDPILVTAQTYEEEALAWHAHTVTDRCAWQPSYDRMTAALPLNALILDLGCGSGEDVPAFLSMGHRVVGLDTDFDFPLSEIGEGDRGGEVDA
jgi:SAM-dependent methyltransferase